MHPSITAIVPTFNRREQCVRAVRSALGQTRAPLEVIVCDNGSTDGTGGTIKELARGDTRVRALALPVNSGSPAAPRNLGVRAARGDWIAFLDDDDEWLPEKLALQAPYLGAAHTIVCANARTFDGAFYFPETVGALTFGRKELLRDNLVITSTAVVRKRALLESGGFPENRRLAPVEDHGAWLKLADSGATGVRLSEVVAEYRTQGDRLSSRPSRSQRAMASLSFQRWIRDPFDRDLAAAALVQWRRVVTLSAGSARRRISTARSNTPS